jgi:hypothetical protein
MNRCPECHRFGIEYDPYIKFEKCPWNDCLWINKNNIDLNKVIYPIKFHKFINAIERKI